MLKGATPATRLAGEGHREVPRLQRLSKHPGERAGIFQAPDFLRVSTERALVTVALRFWTRGREIVVPTRQTWSRPKPPFGDRKAGACGR